MRRTIVMFGCALLALNCIGFLLLHTPSTHAKGIRYTNWDLRGNWASQWSGTVMAPKESPLAPFNGPYCLTGRISVDGMGSVQGNVYDNYAGNLLHYDFQGTYLVNDDGTLTLSVTLYFGQSPYTITVYGVICDDGNQVRVTLIGPTGSSQIPGVPFLGSVATGVWIRQ